MKMRPPEGRRGIVHIQNVVAKEPHPIILKVLMTKKKKTRFRPKLANIKPWVV
jgi:hypothetical protein